MALPETTHQGSTNAIVDARTAWFQPENVTVLRNRLIVRALALVSLGSCQMPPDRSGSNLRQFFHGQEGKVPIDLRCLIQDLAIVRIKSVQLHRRIHSLAVSLQAGKGTQQFQPAHPFDFRFFGFTKAFLQAWQRLLVTS